MGLFNKKKKKEASAAAAAAAAAAGAASAASAAAPLDYGAPSAPVMAPITENQRRADLAAMKESERSDAVINTRIGSLKKLIKQDEEIIDHLEKQRRKAATDLQQILSMQYVDAGKKNRGVKALQVIKKKIEDAERRIRQNETQVEALETRLQQAMELETLKATKAATEAKKFDKDALETAMEDAKDFVQDVADVRHMQNNLDIDATDDIGLDGDEVPDDIMHMLNMEMELSGKEAAGKTGARVDETAALAGLSLAEPTPSAVPSMPQSSAVDEDAAAMQKLQEAMNPTPAM